MRHWQFLLGAAIICGLVSGFWAASLPPNFKAGGAMLVRSVPLTASDQNTSYRDVMGREVTVATELDYLDAPAFRAEIAKQLKPTSNEMQSPLVPDFAWKTGREAMEVSFEDKLDWLNNGLSLTASDESNIIQVGFQSSNPDLAARVVNTVFSLYGKLRTAQREEAIADVVTGLRSRIASVESEMAGANADLLANPTVLAGLGSELTNEDTTALRVALRDAQREASQAQTQYVAASEAYAAAGNDPERLLAVAPTNALEQLQARYGELRQREASLNARYGARHPDMIAVQDESERVETRIRQQAAEAVASLRNEYLAAQDFESQSADRLQGAGSLARSSTEELVAVRGARAQVEALSDTANRLHGELEQILARADVPTAQVVSPAVVPVKDQSPSPPLAAAIAAVFGAAFASLGVIVRTQFGNAGPLTAGRAEALAEAVVFGGIPEFGRKLSGVTPASTRLKGSDPLIESYLSVIAQIEVNLLERGAKVLMFTSPSPGDGKSTSVAFLASQMARCGWRVLVIDGDMHRPSQIEMLAGSEDDRGAWTDIGIGEGRVRVWTDLTGNLAALPAHELGLPPQKLFRSQTAADILAWAKGHFDVILLDTPPVLNCSDAILAGRLADELVLVVPGNAEEAALSEAVRRLREAGIPPAGIVLTKLDRAGNRYSFSSGYESPVEDVTQQSTDWHGSGIGARSVSEDLPVVASLRSVVPVSNP